MMSAPMFLARNDDVVPQWHDECCRSVAYGTTPRQAVQTHRKSDHLDISLG